MNNMSGIKPYSRSLFLWYVILWLFFVYLYIQILQFQADNSNNIILSGLYLIEFGVHEASHIVFGFLPPILVAAAGSIGEVAFTLLIAFAGFKARSYFAGIFGALWVTLSMNSAGIYMADARAQQLPLVGVGEHPMHDWHFVFGQLGWLDADIIIGTVVRALGDMIGFASLLFGLYLLFLMAIDRRVKTTRDSSFK